MFKTCTQLLSKHVHVHACTCVSVLNKGVQFNFNKSICVYHQSDEDAENYQHHMLSSCHSFPNLLFILIVNSGDYFSTLFLRNTEICIFHIWPKSLAKKSIHIFRFGCNLLILIKVQISSVPLFYDWLFQSIIGGHFGCFQFGNAAMSICVLWVDISSHFKVANI